MRNPLTRLFFAATLGCSAFGAAGCSEATTDEVGLAGNFSLVAGDYHGTYSGDDRGDVYASVAGDGSLGFSVSNSRGMHFHVTDRLEQSGEALVSVVGSDDVGAFTLSYTGAFEVDGEGRAFAAGTWESSRGYSGTWQLERQGGDEPQECAVYGLFIATECGACADEVNACSADDECREVGCCMDQCPLIDGQACEAECAAPFPRGGALWNSLVTCAYSC